MTEDEKWAAVQSLEAASEALRTAKEALGKTESDYAAAHYAYRAAMTDFQIAEQKFCEVANNSQGP